jgi:hypothetical protein
VVSTDTAAKSELGLGLKVAHLGGGTGAPPFFTDTNDRALYHASSSQLWALQPLIFLWES